MIQLEFVKFKKRLFFMNKNTRNINQFQDGVKDALPTVFGFLSIGAAFGIIAASEGFTIWQIFLLSAVLYAGSAQFIIIGMLLADSSITSIVSMVFLVNFRMFLQSLAVANFFDKQSLVSKILMGSLVTDESFGIFSLNSVTKKSISINWMHGLNIASWITWWLSSIVFALFGKSIANPQNFGLDFTLIAMFAGLWILTTISFIKDPHENNRNTILAIFMTVIVLLVSMMVFSKVISVLFASILGSLFISLLKKESYNDN